jgi:hypothetical protein
MHPQVPQHEPGPLRINSSPSFRISPNSKVCPSTSPIFMELDGRRPQMIFHALVVIAHTSAVVTVVTDAVGDDISDI